MRQATALGLKLVTYLVIFGVTMPIFGLLGLPRSWILAAVHTLLLWFVDLVILPRFGTVVATVVDALILTLATPLVLGAMAAFPNPLGITLAIALGTAFEWWFHRWLLATGMVE